MNESSPGPYIRNDATPRPSPFTDDNLKRLKEELAAPCIDPNAPIILDPKKGKALLARLEAAEAVIINNERMLDEETPNLTEDWRKKAGK